MTSDRVFSVIGKVFRPVFYLIVIFIFYNSMSWETFGDVPLANLTINQIINGVVCAAFLLFLVWLVFNPKEGDHERWETWGAFGVVVLAGAGAYCLWALRHGT